MAERDYEDVAEQYRELLDEIYPEIKFGDLTYSPSRVLESVDPTAFRQGVLDYTDTLEEDDEPESTEDRFGAYCPDCNDHHR